MKTRSERHGKTRGRTNVLRLGGSSVLNHLMPQSTLGSRSTISPGASARGGFGMGIPSGGGGGAAAALANAGAPVGGPQEGALSLPGIAPPAPPVEIPASPSGPVIPQLPGLTPAQTTPQTGLFPTQPTTPFIGSLVPKPTAPPPGSFYPRIRFN